MEILVYLMLGLTSVIGLAFIVERALALRWGKVVPSKITDALAACQTRDDVKTLRRVCAQKPSPLGRLLLLAADHLDWPKADNVDALQAPRAMKSSGSNAAWLCSKSSSASRRCSGWSAPSRA